MPEAVNISTRAVVRPFTDCTELFERRLAFRIASDAEYSDVTNFPELPPAYEGFELSCRLEFGAKDAAQILSVDPADLSFVAVLTVGAIKLSEAINKFGAEKIVPGAELKIDDARIRKLPAGTPFSVEVALVLAREKPYHSGSPWLPGHWVARRVLTFNSVPQGKSFNIQPIAPADFPALYRVPKETFYYVRCDPDDLTGDRENFQKNVTVFVREDCYKALASGAQSPALDAIYSQMQADIVAQISAKALHEATEATCSESTMQAALLKRLKKNLGMSVEEMKRAATDEPGRFRAMIQGMCDVGPTIAKTILS